MKEKSLSPLLSLLRPHQWLKNGFVALPFLFGHRLDGVEALVSALVAVFSFSLASSAVYVFNDLRDVEADRQHPRKRHRPLAAGTVSSASAIMLGAGCAVAALVSGLLLDPWYIACLLAYFGLNTAYTLHLKRMAGVDVACIGTGFALRVLAGSVAAQVVPSAWLVGLTFLLALFLALAKRREEVLLAEQGHDCRACLSVYTRDGLNIAVSISAAVVAAGYLAYTLSPAIQTYYGTDAVTWTFPFVAAGLLRYLWLTFAHGNSGSPARVLMSDRPLQLCVVGWLLCFAFIVYA